MSNNIQMDLVGYFGFPSAGRSSRSKPSVRRKGKRPSSSSSLIQNRLKIESGADANDVVAETGSKEIDTDDDNQTGATDEQSVDRADKRMRVSIDDSAEPSKIDSVDDTLKEFIDDECSSSEKIVIKDPREKERRKNNASTFSIHSVIYGQSEQLSNQQHSRRLLHGKGSVNIISHLFQRSINPRSRKTRGINSFIQSGQHWNACQTVKLHSKSNLIGEICSMSFDKEGVLLATGDDRGFVRIYDFDDVSALDLKKRNERSRLQATADVDVVAADEVVDVDKDLNQETKKIVGSGVEMDALPQIDAAVSRPELLFRSSHNRIADLQWNPGNQDQLAVSFAQSPEIYVYNVASSKTPLPRLTIGGSSNSNTKGREGIAVMRFLESSLPKKKLATTQILTGGSRGTIRLWLIPGLKRGQDVKDLNARCVWSVDISETSGEGCSDLLILPSAKTHPMDKPLVLLSGNAGSLVLLNTAKCTRKSFSATATPTVQSKWDLYHLTSRKLSKVDTKAQLPARRWMGVNRMCLLGCNCIQDGSSYNISLVLNCGWVLAIKLMITQTMSASNQMVGANQGCSYNTTIQVQILHRTPRIECFNSANEKVTILGGMALNFSLPDIPIPSSLPVSNYHNQMIWLADVKRKKYVMPSKDKYILSEQHGTISTGEASGEGKQYRHPGEGLILLDVTPDPDVKSLQAKDGSSSQIIEQSTDGKTLARLPLSNGTPLSLAMHPEGEWMVVGYGLNGRNAATETLELMCVRKSI